MRALVFEPHSGLRLHEVPEPTVRPGEVIVHVGLAGVCGSDLGVFRGGMPGLPTPLVPGHEFGGVLDDGRRVVVNPMVGCGSCRVCGAGDTHLCARRRILGLTRPGAFAERVAVPLRSIVAADGLDPTRAALVEPIANAVHAWRRAGRPTGPVAIIGAGAIGMSLLHVLRCSGAEAITVVDPVAERRALALERGAAAAGPQLTGHFAAVFDAAGTQQTRADAVACTAPGGTAALLGLHDDVLQLSAAAIITADRSIVGCFGYSETAFHEAVGLAASVDTGWTRVVSIADAEDAVGGLLAGRGAPTAIKTLIRCNEEPLAAAAALLVT